MYTTYILFSDAIQRYYTGYTSQDVDDRLYQHNINYKGFTGKTNDWKVVFTQLFDEKSSALKLESKLKKNGAKRFLSRNNSRITPVA